MIQNLAEARFDLIKKNICIYILYQSSFEINIIFFLNIYRNSSLIKIPK